MQTMRQFIGLILVFSLMVPQGLIAQEIVVSAENESPYLPGTNVACVGMGQTPLPGTSCCSGLTPNSAGKCDELVMSDPGLISCTSGSTCSGGAGCFPQRADDLFSEYSLGGDAEDAGDNQNLVSAQVEEVLNPAAAGGACVHARDCASYSCVSGICENKLVCRFADEGEFAPPGVDCGGSLVKNPATNVCELSPDARNPVHPNLLENVNIQDGGQCQFTLDEQSRLASVTAMKSLRAMEFMFATISVDPVSECYKTVPLLKDQIASPYVEARKNILNNFTDQLNRIEADFRTLIDAQESGSRTLSIHGALIAERDLATRQSSGYDGLVLMYRRNQLFQDYEQAMLATIQNTKTKIDGLSEGMATWNNNDTQWNNGTEVVPNHDCGAKYKRWRPFYWKTITYSPTHKRWTTYYKVSGNVSGNSSVINKEKVALNLSLIGAMTEAEAKQDFSRSTYYLMDPLMYGGLNMSSYGQEQSASANGLFGLGRRDLRKTYKLSGTGSGSLTKIYDDLKPKLKEFYQALKTNPAQTGFVYEPELITTKAKDCFGPGRTAECSEFDSFLEEVTDESFAQFLAYGKSNSANYNNYFVDATSWRRKLFTKLSDDLNNISLYYQTVANHRNTQNECINRLINGLGNSGILTFGNGNGLVEGNSNQAAPAGTLGTLPQGQGAVASGNMVSTVTRNAFSFDLLTDSLKNNKSSQSDRMVTKSTASARGGVGNSGAGTFASRAMALKTLNAKASSSKVDVASKVKAVSDSMKKLSSNSTANSASSLSSANTAGQGSSAFGTAGKTSVSKTEDGEMGKGALDSDPSLNGGQASGGGAGGRTGSANYSESGHGGASTDSKDFTGLSDSDKDRMMSEYERNKDNYQGTEEDGIFKKVSKAYVRNLDKVLTKKKKIEE